jgi:hypothetical protein
MFLLLNIVLIARFIAYLRLSNPPGQQTLNFGSKEFRFLLFHLLFYLHLLFFLLVEFVLVDLLVDVVLV